MFAPPIESTEAWNDAHQYLYSLLWSAFLDLDAYSASRFRKRFRPYSTELVAAELLHGRDGVEQLGIRNLSSPLSRHRESLSPRLVKLGLWTVAPELLEREEAPCHPLRRGSGRRLHRGTLGELQNIIRREAHLEFGVPISAYRFDPDTRPLVPPMLGCGIGETKLTVGGGRRCARVRLDATVQTFFDHERLRGSLEPSGWDLFGYWSPRGERRRDPDGDHLRMGLRLPGGRETASNKWRDLDVRYQMSSTAFEMRVDFECLENAADAGEAGVETGEGPDDGAEYGERDRHIAMLRGFLAFEKVAGRPGITRFVSEREVRFESPNHDQFRVETLMFWHALDLVSFAQRYAGEDAAR